MINTNELRRIGEIAKEKMLSDSGQITAGKMLKRAADELDAKDALIAKLNTDVILNYASKQSYYETAKSRTAEIVEANKLIAKYETVLRNFHEDYDCDTDAHRYGTLCRCCEAERVLRTKGESE